MINDIKEKIINDKICNVYTRINNNIIIINNNYKIVLFNVNFRP